MVNVKSEQGNVKYPVYVAPHIIQYDEHVFVWLDETENVGGVASFLEQAQMQLDAYCKIMNDQGDSDERC